MILNSFSVIDGFFCFIRFAVAAQVFGLAVSAWRTASRSAALAPFASFQDGERAFESGENRGYLLFLSALTLFIISLAGWPLLYALLQSYVPQWDGVMCIYGVTRIGAGASGSSGWLPALLAALQVAKPLIVFIGGACLTAYFVERRFRSAASMKGIFVGLACFGMLALADSSVEAAYLVIPKKGQSLESGCCTSSAQTAAATGDDFQGGSSRSRAQTGIVVGYFGLTIALVGLLIRRLWRVRFLPNLSDRRFRIESGAILVAAALSLPIGWLFLREVAAPRILGLPFHRCPYDLLPQAPESLIAIVAHLFAAFFVGWAAVAEWAGRQAARSNSGAQTAVETAIPPEMHAAALVQRLIYLAAASYSVAALVMTLELWWPK